MSLDKESQSSEDETYSESDLIQMRNIIDKMPISNHKKILKILVASRDELNENKYGVHVNLSELTTKTIDEIRAYIQYVKSQEEEFSIVEDIKTKYKDEFFAQNED